MTITVPVSEEEICRIEKVKATKAHKLVTLGVPNIGTTYTIPHMNIESSPNPTTRDIQ